MDKIVFIPLRGPSVKELEEKICIIDDVFPDAVWAGMNDYRVIEDSILKKIGRQFDYLYFSDPHIISYYLDQILEFLSRDTINHFISDRATMLDIDACISALSTEDREKYRRKYVSM